MESLARLGGKLSKEDDFVFQGTQFILPEMHRNDMGRALKALTQRVRDEDTTISMRRSFKYRPWDGAHAAALAIRTAFGFSVGKPIASFFGSSPPELIYVPTSIDTVEEVPWGAVSLPGLDGTTLYFGTSNDPELGLIFEIMVEGPKKYRHIIEGFFVLVEEMLHKHSIYRGKALDGGNNFVDVNSVSPEDVVYTSEVMRQMEANVFSPIKHAEALAALRQPGKRTVLFEGPYGSGKTLAALLTAQVATQNGWTFILCRPGKDNIHQVIQTAQMYQPAVVFFEDIDVIAEAGDGSGAVTKILDTFDGLRSKGLKLLLAMTTNHVERLHKGMVRPGRLDALTVHLPDVDDGVEKLTKRV